MPAFQDRSACRRVPALSPFCVMVVLLAMLATPARAEWILREEAIMGTRCAVELWADEPARGEAAIEQVFAEFRRIDAAMSTYKPESELSQLNAHAARAPYVVSKELFDLVATSLEYSRLTDGAFDVTYASVGYLYDYRRRVHPDDATLAAKLPGVNWRHVRLYPDRHAIGFERPGMRIDLGGIAKGYAVDRGIEVLRRLGIDRAMVNAGGDTRIIGDRFGRPWVATIKLPDGIAGQPPRIPLTDAAVSTSGDYERYFDEGGVRYHHILDPKTGKSPHALRSVTVIGPTAMRTDALTKGVFVKGPVEGLRMIDRIEDVDAFVVTAEGRVLYSKGLDAR